MLTKGKFLVSFEVPGHTKEYTEGFTEEMESQQKLRNKKK
jgi:hypothetical protein